ncbi:aliphatic sulfonate ABC transporter substrate-binding protein [Nocardiopsis sediminis]|uniref:Aliphatic sulfonate ABC transporter substrate-binding protein n=1 Tax=Nocardiopsis sediminis TaxID=1778267 RepID=A0ABV8FL53_9ACTN
MTPKRSVPLSLATLLATATLLTGCLAGEDGGAASGSGEGGTVRLDYAYYNVPSLVIREKGWLEEEFAADGVDVQWVLSEGSNKANENLRADTIDIGSTAGTPALLARANGTPIQVVDVYSAPEWSAIVVPEDSDIEGPEDLEGRRIAATAGTDPYFFLLQTLEEAGIDPDDITHVDLQHADGRTALERGDVDAWAGLDPHMAQAELAGSRLVYRNPGFNSYGTLNAREDFIEAEPERLQTVLDTYERARRWVADNPDEAAQILADEAGIELEVAERQLSERTVVDNDPVPGEDQRATLERIVPFLVDNGLVASEDDARRALETLLVPDFAEEAVRNVDEADGAEGSDDAADTEGGA